LVAQASRDADADGGKGWGSSPARLIDYGERDGIPVITVSEAELVAVAMALEPADPGCVIDRACDVLPRLLAEVDREAREAVLRNLRPVPRLVQAEAEYRWGIGSGPR
jgi:hypothetical protein